ncbi:hypothetical protein D3C72_932210 [compost metagenome]
MHDELGGNPMLSQYPPDQVFGVSVRKHCGGVQTGFDDGYLRRLLLGGGNHMICKPFNERVTVVLPSEHPLRIRDIQSREHYPRRWHLAKKLAVFG